ncbi:MAG: GldG family protein [Candidatus Nitrotoga sp.]
MNKPKHFLFITLLLIASIGLYQLAAYFPAQADLTQNARNSLTEGSIAVLRQLPESLQLTVYATEQDVTAGNLRKLVRDFVALYQRYKPDITLAFVDPITQPEEARKVNIKSNGEMIIEYAGRSEHITTLNEQSLSSALLRLARSKHHLVMYLVGHGERKLDGIANHDLGEFGKRLQQNGFNLSPLNLALAQDVPGNTSFLLITHPQINMLPGEIKKLLRYYERGGNLLWLVDAEPLRGLEHLAALLNITFPPGMVIDPAATEMNAPLDWTISTSYPPHAITQNFDLTTAFPQARAIQAKPSSEWLTLLETAHRGWISRNSQSGQPVFNKDVDIPGPVQIALTLQRLVDKREQRIVIIGNGAFLANTYVGNGGNMDLGINMVSWLTNDDRLIALQPRPVNDGSIILSQFQLGGIMLMSIIVLPVLLILIGGLLWWRRRSTRTKSINPA